MCGVGVEFINAIKSMPTLQALVSLTLNITDNTASQHGGQEGLDSVQRQARGC